MRRFPRVGVVLRVAAAAVVAAVAVAVAAPAAAGGATVSAFAGSRMRTDAATHVGQYPLMISAGAGYLTVLDSRANVVRRIDESTGTESVILGTGLDGFGDPAASGGPLSTAIDGNSSRATTDASGDAIVLLIRQQRIVVIDPSGHATERPTPDCTGCASVAAAPNGDVYISRPSNNDVIVVRSDGSSKTVVGTGTAGHTGDGGAAASATLSSPTGLAADVAGDLFIVDGSGTYVRKVDSHGTITTVAGTGTRGDTGNGGPAGSAELDAGTLAVDALGDIFVSSVSDNVVRRINVAGTIDRYAGVPETSTSQVGGPMEFAATGPGDGGPARDAYLMQLGGIAGNADGTLYLAQLVGWPGSIIRRVDPGTGMITTFAGNGTEAYGGDNSNADNAGFAAQAPLAVAANGDVLVADTADRAVRRIDSSHTVTTIAGDGQCCDRNTNGPLAPILASPQGLAVDGNGDVYIADSYNQVVNLSTAVSELTPAGEYLPVAGDTATPGYNAGGDGPALDADVAPSAISVNADGTVFVGDRCTVRAISGGTITTIAGQLKTCTASGDGGPARNARMTAVDALAIDTANRLIVVSNDGVHRIDTDGTWTRLCNCGGHSVAVDSTGTIYLDGVNRLDPNTGTFTYLAGPPTVPPDGGDGGPLNAASFYSISGSALAPDGTLYVSDFGRIRTVNGLAAPAQPPSAPTTVAATAGDRTATVTWRPPADLGGDLPRSYTVLVEPGNQTVPLNGTTETAIVTGLTDGVTYTASVTATNAAGNSPAASTTFTPHAPPTVAITSAPQPLVSSRDASVTWTINDPNGANASSSCQLDNGPAEPCSSGQTFSQLADGTHDLVVTVSDAYGGGGSATARWTVDGTAPTVTLAPPTHIFSLGSFTFTWAGHDNGSGVSAYQLRGRRAAFNATLGKWNYPPAWQHLTNTRVRYYAPAGDTDCVSVRAVDAAGNWSRWSPARCQTRPVDDRALTTAGRWHRGTGRYYLGTITSSTETGARLATRRAAGDRLAIVATRCPSCGTISVTIGAYRLATLHLTATHTIREAVFVLPRIAHRAGVIAIRIVSTRRSVQIDGLGLTRN